MKHSERRRLARLLASMDRNDRNRIYKRAAKLRKDRRKKPERGRDRRRDVDGGKGRHTTTAATLHDLPGGGRVIDTPGIRALGLTRLEPKELRRCFPEFETWATGCRFRDCSHSHEPDCKVQTAVTEGRIPHHEQPQLSS